MKKLSIISRYKFPITILILLSLISFLTIYPFVGRESWYFMNENYPNNESLRDIALSENGKYIVVGETNGKVSLFSNAQPNPIWVYSSLNSSNAILDVEISASGEVILAFTLFGQLLAFNPSSAVPIWVFETDPDTSYDFNTQLSMSSDGNNFLLVTNDYLFFFNKDNPVPIWNESSYRGGILSDDGNIILATQGNQNLLFESQTFTLVWNYTGIEGGLMAISQNGERFAIATTSSYNFYGKNLYFFQKNNLNPIWNFTGYESIYDLDISSSGNEITVVDNKYLYLFTNDSSIPHWKYELKSAISEAVAISSDGKYIVSIGLRLLLFDKSSSTPIRTSYYGFGGDNVFISGNGDLYGFANYNSFYIVYRNNPLMLNDFGIYFVIIFGLGYPSVITAIYLIVHKKRKNKIEQKKFQKFKELISQSDEIEIDELYKFFKKDYDDRTFYRKILEWASEFNFTIDGEKLLLTESSISGFIKLLDDMYLKWEGGESHKHDKDFHKKE